MDNKINKRHLVELLFAIHFLSIIILIFAAIYLIIDIGHIPKYENPSIHDIRYVEWLDYTVLIVLIIAVPTLIMWLYWLVLLMIKAIKKKSIANYLYTFFYSSFSLFFIVWYSMNIIEWLMD